MQVSIGYTHTQPFYGSVEFVRDNPDEPVPVNTTISYCCHHFEGIW